MSIDGSKMNLHWLFKAGRAVRLLLALQRISPVVELGTCVASLFYYVVGRSA